MKATHACLFATIELDRQAFTSHRSLLFFDLFIHLLLYCFSLIFSNSFPVEASLAGIVSTCCYNCSVVTTPPPQPAASLACHSGPSGSHIHGNLIESLGDCMLQLQPEAHPQFLWVDSVYVLLSAWQQSPRLGLCSGSPWCVRFIQLDGFEEALCPLIWPSTLFFTCCIC